MIKFSTISIFPEILENFKKYGLIEKAIKQNSISLHNYNLRDFTDNKHKKVDDRPFGGGPGMVLMPAPLFKAVNHIKKKETGRVILFSAYGSLLNQKKVNDLSKQKHLILVCGRYESVDQRFIDHMVDEEISIGEYILMGGEIAAEVIIECVSRKISGVVGNYESVKSDSFYYKDQMAFPQYTFPREFKGIKIPEILLSGHHEKIENWRKKNQKNR